ncbi:MAG: glycosyltransferase [Cyanobacteria bacterium J06592_8]
MRNFNLSVVIICQTEWEGLFDAITSLELSLENIEEIIIAVPVLLNPDEEEIVLYFKSQGYVIYQFSGEFDLAEVLKYSNQTTTGKYILPLRTQSKISPHVSTGLEIQEHPLVSVCIPTYNGDRFIAEAISSVLSQTYSSLEVIVSDDGSTDHTINIAQRFQDQTSVRFLILPHKSLGLADNCNFAISQAQGKYIKFLFQDDLLAPKCITEMVKIAEQDHKIGLVFSPREICFVDEVAKTDSDLMAIYQDFQDLHQAWLNLKPIQLGSDLLKDPNLFEHPINKIGEPSTVLIQRNILEKIGGFDPNLNQLVDLDLWLRIMGNYKIGFVNQVLSYFRLHTQQKTYQNIAKNVSTDLKFYYKVYFDSAYQFLPQDVRDRALCIYTINLNHFYLYDCQNGTETFLDDLRLLRQAIAQYWRQTSEQLNPKPSLPFRKTYQILLRNKQFRQEPLTRSEQIFVQNLVEETMSLSSDNIKTGQFLALMLYPNLTHFLSESDLFSLSRSIPKDILDLIMRKGNCLSI